MDVVKLGALIEEIGLGNVLSLVICIAFFFILKWVLKTSSDQLKAMTEERKDWLEIYRELKGEITCLTNSLKVFMAMVKTEHHGATDLLNTIKEQLAEISLCLGRINGYTKEG